MKPALLVLAALVALFLAADRWLAARAAGSALARQRVGTLFTLAEAAELRKVPALTLELPGERHRYGRIAGEWRCLSLFDAPADGRALQGLIDTVVGTEGLVHTREVAAAPRYGINVPETARIFLQGPAAAQGGDVRAALEVGAGNGQGCFARRQGTKEIWSVAGDLRATLAQRVAPGLPPLLAASLVPAKWREESGGIVRVERAGAGEPLVVERRERELDPTTMQPGMLPWTWVLAPGADEVVEDGFERFVGRLENLAYDGVLDPKTRAGLGLEPPLARVTLVPRSGAPLVLAFGTRDVEGAPVWIEASGTLYRVAASELDAVFAPRAALLAEIEAQKKQQTEGATR
jgi:hypothetical protein